MRTRLWIVYLVVVLCAVPNYKAHPLLAQEETVIENIRSVISSFLQEVNRQEIRSAMRFVSNKYLEIYDNKRVDYVAFESIIEKVVRNYAENFVDQSIGKFDIKNRKIEGDKVYVEIEYIWNGFNMNTLNDEHRVIKRFVTLMSEDGSWKIIKWQSQEQVMLEKNTEEK